MNRAALLAKKQCLLPIYGGDYMALDSFIVSDFVKATTEKKKKNETTVFGTVNSYTDSDGRKYVKIDGAEELTPVMTTAELKEGDRVAILVKDHSAIIMGNITSQSASTNTVEKVKETADTANTNATDAKQTADTANTNAADAKQTADNLEERANNGEFNGADGKGISNITEYYLVTSESSGVTISTSGWTTTIQSMTSYKRYLWNYRKTEYTTGNPTNTTPCIIGVYGTKGDTGAQGATGATGRSVKEIVDQYAKSSSSSVAPASSSFSEQIPEWTSGEYIWRRQKVTWLLSDDTTDITYTEAIADMAFSTLFTQDIYMTGTFTTTRKMYLLPTIKDYDRVNNYIQHSSSSTIISDDEKFAYKPQSGSSGGITEDDLAWFKDGAFCRSSISQAEMAAKFPDLTDGRTYPNGSTSGKSDVTFTISLNDVNSIIKITGINIWGTEVVRQFGSGNPFAGRGTDYDKWELDYMLDEYSDIIDNIQKDITNLKVLTGNISIDDALSPTSTNPVQNKVVKEALDAKLDKKLIMNYTEDEIQALWDDVFKGGQL